MYIIGILLIILVVVMIVLFYNKKDCDSDFSLMMIDKSAIPEINGYSFEIKMTQQLLILKEIA